MRLLLLPFLLAVGVAQAFAQNAPSTSAPAAAQAPAPAPGGASAAVPSDYRVGPQDVLTITVYGEPQLSGKFRVDADGSFPFQYLGRVQVDDLTLTQIETVLRKGLGDGYLKNPQISVEIDQ